MKFSTGMMLIGLAWVGVGTACLFVDKPAAGVMSAAAFGLGGVNLAIASLANKIDKITARLRNYNIMMED